MCVLELKLGWPTPCLETLGEPGWSKSITDIRALASLSCLCLITLKWFYYSVQSPRDLVLSRNVPFEQLMPSGMVILFTEHKETWMKLRAPVR